MKGPILKRIRSQIMSTYAGQMSEMYRAVSLPAVCYLQKDASPQKKGQILCWSMAADVYQTHPAFFIAVASVITTYLFSIHSIPTLRVPQHGRAYDDTLVARYDFTSERSR